MRTKVIATVVCAAALWAGGCAGPTYYKVHDPTTGKDYYTKKLKLSKDGSATLTDARTGNQVNIKNSEVAKVKKEVYETGKNTPPVAPPQPNTNPTK